MMRPGSEIGDDPLLVLLQIQESSRDAHHETAPERPHHEPATRQKPRFKWSKASDKTPWRLLDEDLDSIYEASMQGPVDGKIQTLTTPIYSVAKERFGLEETRVPRDLPKPNRRQTSIENLRRILNQLRQRFRVSSPSEQLGLSELRDTLRSQLTSLRKAENTRKKTRERGKKGHISLPTHTSLENPSLTRNDLG